MGLEYYNLTLINDLCNMWDGNLFSNLVTRNLAGGKVWLRLVYAMEWRLMLVVGFVLVPVGF
jgi:hypothetical protein